MRPGRFSGIVTFALIGACTPAPSATPSTTTSSTAPQPATTTSSTTTSTLAPVPVWVRAETPARDPDLEGGDILFTVVEFEGRLVAAGHVGPQPAIWESKDGLAWTAVSDPDLATAVGEIRDLVVGGPGLVAVGEAFTGESWAPRPAIWASADGRQWTRVPHDPEIFGFPNGGTIRAVTTGPGGLIAIGGEFFSRPGRTVWKSVDGLEWTRLPHNDELGAVNDLIEFNDSFLGVGAHDGAAVWRSSDGLRWTSAAVPPAEGPEGPFHEMQGVTVVNGSLIAVGSDGGPAVWWSENGTEWTRVRQVLPDGSMWDVTTLEDQMIAVGAARNSQAEPEAATVWRSHDGLTWIRDEAAALGADSTIFAATPFLGGIAAVGYDSSGGPFAAAWYIGPSTATAPTTTTTVAPSPTIVTPPSAPEFLMRCSSRTTEFESPPPTTYPNCAWRVFTDPFWSLARWTLDPDNPPAPSDTALHILATEAECAGGAIPEGREVESFLMTSGDDVVVFVLIEPSQLPMTCQGNPSFPMTIDLGRPLGDLRIYEGFLVPPFERYPVP